MHKFESNQTIQCEKLTNSKPDWVCTDKEGNNADKWVVKCIQAKDQEEIYAAVKNIFFNARSHSLGIVPVVDYHVQETELGYHNVYVKMPRLQQSIKDLITKQCNIQDQDRQPSTDYVVRLLYSIAKTLDSLAKRNIFHNNLKPTNILLNHEGDPFLSDLCFIEPSGRKVRRQTTGSSLIDHPNEDPIYSAPETFSAEWTQNAEDLHKSDVWSLGIIILELCLLDKLRREPPDALIQAIEENLTVVRTTYGASLAEVLGEMLKLNPNERVMFSQICGGLEERYYDNLRDLKPKLDNQMNHQVNVFGSECAVLQVDDDTYYNYGNKEVKDDSISLDPKLQETEGYTLFVDSPRTESHGKIKTYKYWIIGGILLASLIVGLVLLFSFSSKPNTLSQPLMGYDLEGLVFENEAQKNSSTKYQEVMDYLNNRFGNSGAFFAQGGNMLSFGWGSSSSDNVAQNDDTLISFTKVMIEALKVKGLLNLVNGLNFFLNGWKPVTDQALLQAALSLVEFPAVKKLEFSIGNALLTTQGVKNFLNVFITSKRFDIESFKFNLVEGYHVEYLSFIYSIILQGFPNLKDISSQLRNIPTTDDDLARLNSVLSQHGQNLTNIFFWLLEGMPITSSGLDKFISEFGQGLGNLVELSLLLPDTEVFDSGLESLADSLSAHCLNLKKLQVTTSYRSPISNQVKDYFRQKLSFVPDIFLSR